MTLTELRYIVAVAREGHFGRAAESCFVSQPTLSVAIRRLEEELGVPLFERRPGSVVPTPAGSRIVRQAQRVLEEAELIRDMARQNRDPLAQPLRLGVIYTIGPYLLPGLVASLKQRSPTLSLVIEENLTARLAELLHHGELDVLILSQPFDEPGIETLDLYEEPFRVALPHDHPQAVQAAVDPLDLERDTMLMLGTGHCFRDQVLSSCPDLARPGAQKAALEGSSLETIRYMVATGIGVSILPSTAIRPGDEQLFAVRPFAGEPPVRRVSLAWRRSFPRREAVRHLAEAVRSCQLEGVRMLPAAMV